jgi:lipopolysaccharide transport system permease protein
MISDHEEMLSPTISAPPLPGSTTPVSIAATRALNMNVANASPREFIIEAGRSDSFYWQDLWRFRELFRVLAWRDVSIRYKQTVIGAAWALIRPFLTMVVFTIVFGKIAELPSPGAPYALMVFAGLLPWMLFSTALSDASASLVTNSNLISKVYFPRLIVPCASVIVSLVDFLISLGILGGLMLWYQFIPSPRIVLLPFYVVLAFLASLSPALWITALNVKYRDFRYVIPFIVQFGLYISPVGFNSSVVPDKWRIFYSLNPLVGVIDGFRWCILGGGTPLYLPAQVLSVATTALLLWFGIRQFRKMERSFADLI